jgi:hypothetical protein
MIQAYMSQLHCDEETSEFSSADEPYVLVSSVDLAQPFPASNVVLYGAYEDVDKGDNRFANISQSFWGVKPGEPEKLDDPERAIFIVALMENDHGSPAFTRSMLGGVVTASLSATQSFPRPDKVNRLLKDVSDALDPAISVSPH